MIVDGTLGQTSTQINELWRLREDCSVALQKKGFVYKYDLSIPLFKFYELVEVMRDRIKEKGIVVGYGHIGDGNLHLNISTPKFDPNLLQLIEPFVYEWTGMNLNNSIPSNQKIK